MRARIAPWLFIGCLLSAPAFANIWSNLWRTPDQQGQALLEAGRPSQAALHFTSVRRKAYADLEAGNYAQAAHLLTRFRDATSEYNRGNALAHLGQLRAALAAYDAALRQAPHDRDIRHNRDLIKRMLAHQPQQHNAARRSGSSAGASGQQTHSGTGHGSTQSGNGQKQRHGQSQTPGPSGSQAPGAQTGQRSASAQQPATNGQGPEQNPSTAHSSPAGSAIHGNRAGQARADAALAAAIARQAQHKGANVTTAQAPAVDGARHTATPEPQPPPAKRLSEKTLALKQWLRQIPNNPAGLLRRKFLIQYLMRHPGENP